MFGGALGANLGADGGLGAKGWPPGALATVGEPVAPGWRITAGGA